MEGSCLQEATWPRPGPPGVLSKVVAKDNVLSAPHALHPTGGAGAGGNQFSASVGLILTRSSQRIMSSSFLTCCVHSCLGPTSILLVFIFAALVLLT